MNDLVVPISHDWTTLGTGGGIETFLKTFLQHASEWDLNVTVLCSGPRNADVNSVHFRPIMPHAGSELEFTRQLRHELTRGSLGIPRQAVILANTEHYAWAFRGMGSPIVLMSHGSVPDMLRLRHSSIFVRFYRFFIERYAVKHADQVVLASPETKSYYLAHYRKEIAGKLTEIPLGLDLRDLEDRPKTNTLERLSLSPTSDLILFVGRLYPEKNLQLFIAACDLLRERGDELHALVIGDGVQAGTLRDAMSTRPWLHWIPAMTHSEVLDAMAVSRALVICSSYESGPLVLLEALGLGTPVVSSDVGRARELIEGYLGRIVSGDPRSVAEGIQEVRSWSREDVRRASAQVRRRIDFLDTMKALVEVVNSLKSTASE